MVMTHEFEHAFVKKMKERQTIEAELNKIAVMQEKNAKHNVYLTRGQQLRNKATLEQMERNNQHDALNSFLETNK